MLWLCKSQKCKKSHVHYPEAVTLFLAVKAPSTTCSPLPPTVRFPPAVFPSLPPAGMFSCQVAVGGSRTQGVALALNQPHDAFQPLPIDEGLLAEIADQRAAVQAASQQLAAARKVTKAAGVSGGVAAAGGGNPKEGKLRAARLLRKAARIKEEMGMAMETTWNGFLQVMDILMAMGALEEETMAIQPLGLLARSLQVGDGKFKGSVCCLYGEALPQDGFAGGQEAAATRTQLEHASRRLAPYQTPRAQGRALKELPIDSFCPCFLAAVWYLGNGV